MIEVTKWLNLHICIAKNYAMGFFTSIGESWGPIKKRMLRSQLQYSESDVEHAKSNKCTPHSFFKRVY